MCFQSLFTASARCVVEICGFTGKVCDIGLAQFVALKTMDELCPLCLKMGNNKRIKAVQINLEEAVWTCENEDCPWPFGYEAPAFLPRKVGFKHASKWQVYKKVQKHVGPIPVSTELSLYTPPVTPSSDTASKESTKSEFSGETNISEHLNRMGNILRCPNDSYAPKSSDEFTKKTQALNSCAEHQAAGFCEQSPKAPIPQSIFDIDSKDLPSDEIIIKDVCVEPKKPDPLSAFLEIVDIGESEKLVETVLKACADEIGQNDGKIEAEVAAIVAEATGEVNSIETTVGVKKISDLPVGAEIIDRQAMVDGGKSVDPKDKDLLDETESESGKEMKVEGSPMEIEDKSLESEIPRTRPTLGETLDTKQHTMTTITLGGSLPITLSYDPTSLEEKFEDKVAQTSPLVRGDSMEKCQGEAVEKGSVESSVELVKKRIRPATKRRAALIGKQYEKFSFSGLKKSPESKKSSSDVLPNERTKLEELKIVNVEHSPTSDPVEKIICEASNQVPESLIAGVIESIDSGKNGDDPIVENLNLSGLDDFLLDGYQNATVNLNDDWLESFLTTLDT